MFFQSVKINSPEININFFPSVLQERAESWPILEPLTISKKSMYTPKESMGNDK